MANCTTNVTQDNAWTYSCKPVLNSTKAVINYNCALTSKNPLNCTTSETASQYEITCTYGSPTKAPANMDLTDCHTHTITTKVGNSTVTSTLNYSC